MLAGCSTHRCGTGSVGQLRCGFEDGTRADLYLRRSRALRPLRSGVATGGGERGAMAPTP
jgi:hypothetical protein